MKVFKRRETLVKYANLFFSYYYFVKIKYNKKTKEYCLKVKSMPHSKWRRVAKVEGI